MPSNFGSTPYSSETLPANTFPVSAVFVPGTASGNLTAMQGGPATTDGNSYTSAPGSIYIADGNDVTQGTSTDAAGHNSVIGQLKQIQTNTASVTIGSGTVTANQGGSWAVTANAGTNLNTSALALESGGNLAAILADTADIEINTANIPPLGQALAAGSVPVVLTAAQQTALTPPAAITGFALEAGHLATIDTHTPALGQAAMAASVPVTIASNQSAVPVSGTVTANAGTGTFTIQSNASVNVNQVAGSSVATAATGIMKVGLTDGSGNAITSTSNALNVNIASGGGSGFSVVDEAAWTAGTSAMVPAGGVFNDSAAALTSGQEGTVRVTTNRAIHSNLRDASGNQLLGSKTSANSIPVVIASDQGAYAVSQSGSWAVTANAGTNLNTSALALDTSVNGLLLAQASTTSGQKGPLMLGAVTTNAPSYTTAQTSPLSLDASGLLRASLKDTPSNTNNLNVAIAASSATVTVSGTVTANQGGSNWSANVAQFGGSNVVTGTGASGSGIPRVTVSNDSNVLATQSGTWTVQPGNTPNSTAWLVQDVAGTTGGSTPSHTMSAASTNATSLKASAGMIYGLSISNNAASARYFKLYNKASAPTVGTDTPVLTLQVPANGTVIRAYPIGLALGTGIAWAATGAITDADTTAIGLNDLSIDIDYK